MLKLPLSPLSRTGEGGSGGAIALATANAVIMLEHSIYSVVSPEGCASLFWRNAFILLDGTSHAPAQGETHQLYKPFHTRPLSHKALFSPA